ncbi:glycosyltransferase family 4 protein [Geodermatophilus nigrescens]
MSALRPLHVLLLTDGLEVGGLERVVVTLAHELTGRGHRVTVAAEPGGALWDELPDSAARAHAPLRRAPRDHLRYVRWLARLVRRGRFDVVHAHQRGVALQARVLRAGLRTRVVEHVHNTFPARGPARYLSFRGDRLVACGAAIADMLVTGFGRPAGRVATVANAVPDIGAGRDLTIPATVGGRRPTVLAVGRVSAQKDPHRFIDVVAALNRHARTVDAVWVGEGGLLEECRARVAAEAVDGLSFVGRSDDVPGWMLRADVVLLTSRWEGLPLVLLEAAALGRPVVTPDVGSCAEAVAQGRNGVLYDADAAPEDIADQVSGVLEPATLRRMGEEARRLYLERYTLDGQADRIEEVYRHVLDG